MADKKISALTAATTPLAGTEVLPIVQSGSTVKVAVSDLTAGRAVSASSVTTTGAVTVGTYVLSSAGGTFPGALTTTGFYQYSSATYGFVLYGYGSASDVVIANKDGTAALSVPHAAADVKFDSGNLIQGTAAKGVNFTANTPAAGMTSQLLNWYEEGAWTPNQGAGLTVVGAFSSSGKYTRIGNVVTVSGQVTGGTSVEVAASGVISSNLPFTANNQLHFGGACNFNATVSSQAFVNPSSASFYSIQAIAASATIYFNATYCV